MCTWNWKSLLYIFVVWLLTFKCFIFSNGLKYIALSLCYLTCIGEENGLWVTNPENSELVFEVQVSSCTYIMNKETWIWNVSDLVFIVPKKVYIICCPSWQTRPPQLVQLSSSPRAPLASSQFLICSRIYCVWYVCHHKFNKIIIKDCKSGGPVFNVLQKLTFGWSGSSKWNAWWCTWRRRSLVWVFMCETGLLEWCVDFLWTLCHPPQSKTMHPDLNLIGVSELVICLCDGLEISPQCALLLVY